MRFTLAFNSRHAIQSPGESVIGLAAFSNDGSESGSTLTSGLTSVKRFDTSSMSGHGFSSFQLAFFFLAYASEHLAKHVLSKR